MAKRPIKNHLSPEEAVARFAKRMKKTVGDTHNKRNLKKYGKLAAKRILLRTRKGSGTEKTNQVGGQVVKLKKLSDKYIAYRKRILKGDNKTAKALGITKKKGASKRGSATKRQAKKLTMHTKATAKKSNLTFSGQLLNSLKVTRINTQKGSFTVEPTGKRKDGKTNKEVGKLVAEAGRHFMGLTNADQSAINKLFKQTLAESIRKRLTK